MPTYDYHCPDCGHQMEAFQKIKEEPLSTCPKCKKNHLQRGIGGGQISFQFKGKGFYLTDYCQKPDNKPNEECCPCGKKKKCD